MALNVVERTVKLTMVTPGMLLRIQYKTGIYNVFVVNPTRRNEQTGRFQLHGYKLAPTATESDLINLLVNLNAGLVVDSVNKELRMDELTDTAAYEARYVLRGVDARPYRTFNIEDIISATQLSFELPEVIDRLVDGDITITNKSSKRLLLTAAQLGDEKSMRSIPEIRQRITTPNSVELNAIEEAAERENDGGATTKIRDIPAPRVLRNSQ